MGVKVILDTDILSEYFKGHNANVAARAASYAKEYGLQEADILACIAYGAQMARERCVEIPSSSRS
jgi:HD-GYP domain-containing protein (c-di-GMP phosphodiesterase class II)